MSIRPSCGYYWLDYISRIDGRLHEHACTNEDNDNYMEPEISHCIVNCPWVEVSMRRPAQEKKDTL